MFYLIKHGRTDYSERNTKIYQGFGVHLSSLSALGVQQIKDTAKDSRLQGADIILSSPYTRALQTAAILSKELQLDIIVETDLHEWMANKNYIYEPDKQAELNYHEYVAFSGKYPDCVEKDWEDSNRLKDRLMAVLSKYRKYNKVIVVCHGMLIQSIENGSILENGKVVEFDFD